jgi:hypothetical protein
MEFLIGFGVALLIGLTGVGGGTLTVPVLVLYLRVPIAAAVGTALTFSTLVKLPAAFVYFRQRQVDGRVLRRLLVGGLPGVVAGALLLGRLESAGLRPIVLTVVGVTIAATALLGLLGAARRRAEAPPPPHRSARQPLLAAPIGLEVGFSSAGAGALGTLLLLALTPLTPAQVVGTDLAFGLLLSATGGALHLGLGDLAPDLLLHLVAGGVPGAFLGAWLATRVPARALRLGLLVWLVYLGAQLALRGFGEIAA